MTRVLLSKGINFGNIVANPNGTFDVSGVQGINGDLRVRPFFAQGGTVSIREFLVGAFNAEMGLESPDIDLIAAQTARVVTPAGMVLDGRVDFVENAPVQSPEADSDGDGVTNEIPVSIVDFMEFYLLNYFKAATGKPSEEATLGRILFTQIGCTSCHVPNLTIDRDRRAADVETVYNPTQGNPLNNMFATATVLAVPDPSVPAIPDVAPAGLRARLEFVRGPQFLCGLQAPQSRPELCGTQLRELRRPGERLRARTGRTASGRTPAGTALQLRDSAHHRAALGCRRHGSLRT